MMSLSLKLTVVSSISTTMCQASKCLRRGLAKYDGRQGSQHKSTTIGDLSVKSFSSSIIKNYYVLLLSPVVIVSVISLIAVFLCISHYTSVVKSRVISICKVFDEMITRRRKIYLLSLF